MSPDLEWWWPCDLCKEAPFDGTRWPFTGYRHRCPLWQRANALCERLHACCGGIICNMEHMRRRTLQAHTQSQDMCCRRDPIAPQHISERPYSEIRRLFQGPVLVVQCTAYRQLRFSDLQPMCRSYIVRNPYISRSIDDQSDHTELSTKYSRRKLLYEKKFGDKY